MAGAVDLLLYGIAVFISPVAVYFKKGVGVQFWVNCCLYCLMGVPGMIHAFYIIHTNKHSGKAPQQSPTVPNPVTQEYSSRRPSLPHSDRYRPPSAFSPYEDQPPPVPAKLEDQLPYDPALHPNNRNTPIGRAKAVLHTYQIPESTLHPSPLRSRRLTPSPDPPPRPNPSPRPELPPLPQPESETRATSSTAHPDPGTLPYPAEYHPNSTGANIANAKAVLHTYQIPETTLTAPDDTPAPPPAEPDETLKRNKTTSSIMKGSMWPLRSKGKGLSPLDVNSPTAVPKPDSTLHRSKWSATGPSWLKRRREREEQGKGAVTTDEEGPTTMTMVWDDNFEVLQPVDQDSKPAKGHARSASEPVALAFPAPPGAIRPVVDRTGTSNTVLLNPVRRRDVGLEAVDENTPAPESTVSEGEAPADKIPQTDGHAGTDTEVGRSKSRLITRLGRRQPQARPPLDTVPDATPPTSTASAPPNTETKPPVSPTWHRHIAPPAILATSIDEPRSGFFNRRRSSSEHSPEPPNTGPRSASSLRRDIDFTIGEYGLGGSGDAYSAASRAIHRRDRSGSGGGARGLPIGAPGGKRLSNGTTFTQDTMSTPVMRRGWTQGTFGTGITDMTADTSAATEDGGKARSTTNRSKSYEDVPREERSQDEQIDEWIQREDERRSASALNSRAPTSHGHSSSPGERHVVPDEESLFSEESSGFAGIGVGTAVEKGRTGRLEVWDQPNWDGSSPSASGQSHSNQGASVQSYSNRDGYPYANRKHEENSFKDPAASSTVTHSSYATGEESLPVTKAPISPPTSPERPARPTRAPPAAPGSRAPTNPSVKQGIPRMATFGAVGREDAPPSFASLSTPNEAPKSSMTTSPHTHTISPPASPPRPPASSKPAIYKVPAVPARPNAVPARAQSPRLPPKPAVLRTLSTEDDDMSEVYARALRDEI